MRITPSSGNAIDLTQLEDDEPYKAVIRKPKDGWYSEGSEQYGGGQRLTIDFELEDGVSTIRDWISLRLGKQQNGTVSKLRMLLNALSQKPRDTEVRWFDSDTMEWGYDDSTRPDNVITEGMEVLFRGVHGKRQDGAGKFTIQKFGSVAKPKVATEGKKKVGKADEVPF